MTFPASPPSAEDLEPVRDRRRQNLNRLVAEYGGAGGLANAIDMSSLVIASLLKPWDEQIAGMRATVDDALARRLEFMCDLPLGCLDAGADAPVAQAPQRSVDPASPVNTYDLLGRLQRDLALPGLVPVRLGNAIGFERLDLRLRPELYEYDVQPPRVTVTLRVAATSARWSGTALIDAFNGVGDAGDPLRSLEAALDVALTAMKDHWLGAVLMAAGWPGPHSLPVSCERRTHGRQSWTVWGAPLAQPKAPQLGPAYAAFRETLDGLLAATEPRAATAVRVIVRAYSGRILHTTVTRANRPWPQASERLAAHAWPSVQGYESLRHFELFLPD